MSTCFLVLLGSVNTIYWTAEANIGVPPNANQLLDAGGPITLNWAGEANIGVLQNGGQLLGHPVIC
jgi:hypothetical protein